MNFRIGVLVFFAGAGLAGCTLLPGAGPDHAAMENVEDTGEHGGSPLVVDLNERVVTELKMRGAASLSSFTQYQAAVAPVIGVGDIIKVNVWEAAPGNLFSASSGQSNSVGSVGGTTIPEQAVPRSGGISVPFAGDIKVVGKLPREVEAAIVKRLSTKAVDPQALVTVVKSAENSVTVTGDAAGGGQVQLGPNNERILDAVAMTGGIKTPVHDTFVSLTRGSRVVTVPFLTLTKNPSENIRLSPHDVIGVYGQKRTYTVLGAAGRQAEVSFDAAYVTLAQAVARAGGLDDDKADKTGVFVYRFEPTHALPAVFREKPPGVDAEQIPVIYRLNLADPKGLFYAQAFYMREGDIVYITNAPGAELAKFLRIVGTAVSPVVSGAAIYNTAK